jgi:hypothetical protein
LGRHPAAPVAGEKIYPQRRRSRLDSDDQPETFYLRVKIVLADEPRQNNVPEFVGGLAGQIVQAVDIFRNNFQLF